MSPSIYLCSSIYNMTVKFISYRKSVKSHSQMKDLNKKARSAWIIGLASSWMCAQVIYPDLLGIHCPVTIAWEFSMNPRRHRITGHPFFTLLPSEQVHKYAGRMLLAPSQATAWFALLWCGSRYQVAARTTIMSQVFDVSKS
jgi:hypothetical protein